MVTHVLKCLVVLIFFLLSPLAHGGTLKEGVHLYKQGNYSEAVTQFATYLLKHPGDALAHYNMGDALYRMGKYEQAEKSYLSAIYLSRNDDLKEKAWFNLGNTYFRQGKLEEAIASYRQALKINPDDVDAKKNLAYAENLLKKIRKMAQKTANKVKEKKEKKGEKKGEKTQLANAKKSDSEKRKKNPSGGRNGKGEREIKKGKKQISPQVARMLLRNIKEKRPSKKKRVQVGGLSAGPEW